MKLKGYLCFSFLICAAAAAPAFTQVRAADPFRQVSASEPFEIGPGSSFSASSGRPPKAAVAKHTIAADVDEALQVINKSHISGKDLDTGALTRSAIKSMLHTLDPHSSFFDTVEFRELLQEQQSEYFGIGSTIANYERNGRLDTYVVAVLPKSPAFKAGLRFGDRIHSVEGESMSGKDAEIVKRKIRGPNGTSVRMIVERAASGRQDTIEIRRGRVMQPSIVDSYLIRPGVGYIDLSTGFNFSTSKEFDRSLGSLQEQGAKSLILDLRGNTGGILEQAVKVAERFIPAGDVIVSQRGRYASDSRTWRASRRDPQTIPLVILVDGKSASASEVVAGALQDNDRALIVGERTFGKGLVQNIIDLPGQTGLTLTTARYYTPSGRSLQRDYSNGSLYDYYRHEPNAASARTETKTLTRRKVYGGEGIAPDEVISAGQLTAHQLALIDPLFFFAVDIANGRIEDHVTAATNPDGDSSAIGETLVDAFLKFVESEKGWPQAVRSAPNERAFAALRLRYLLALATAGNNAAAKLLIENDPQVLHALKAIPRADELAKTARNASRASK